VQQSGRFLVTIAFDGRGGSKTTDDAEGKPVHAVLGLVALAVGKMRVKAK
jgi:hypothetical protein